MKPKIDTTFFRDPALPGIDICRVQKSRHHFPEHFHDDLYIIGLIFSGRCYCLGKKRQDTASGPGCVTLLNPGQIHFGAPADNRQLDYATCHINLKTMVHLSGELDITMNKTPEFSGVLLNDPLLSALIKNLFKTMFTSHDSLEKEALMISACHFIFSRYGAKKNRYSDCRLRHQPVIQAKELLSSELDRKLSLSEIAGSVGLSQYHFLRTFKRETGISPHLYRTLKRIESARVLLENGTPPVKVALETGFADQSHFSNTFRRYVGATPRQYLAQN